MNRKNKLIFLFLLVSLIFCNINVNALDLKNVDKNIKINPEYVKYLKTSPDKRDDLMPMPVISMYSDSGVKDYESLPASYDLRNVNGMNYVTPIGNQGNLGICWTFATNSALESYLLKTSNTSYSSSAKIFSERQLDYATSANGMNNYTSQFMLFGNRTLGNGGNIYRASEVMANGVGAFYYSSFKSTLDKNTMEMADVINYKNSIYELNSTIIMPRLNSAGAELDLTNPDDVQKRENYLNEVKNYIMTYGAAYVGSTSSQSGCAYYDSNLSNYVIDKDATCTVGGHAMSIIGWDDNIEYAYCASNSATHSANISSCPSEYIVRGKGVWILKNSWGTSHTNPYLTYDSLDSDIAFITGVNLTSSRIWDNSYTLRNGSSQSNGNATYGFTYLKFNLNNTNIVSSEKLKKVKFMTFYDSPSGTPNFEVYVENAAGDKIASKTVSALEPGLFTADFSSDNITVDKNSKIVIISNNSGNYVFDFAYVFTSNINKNVSVKANPLTVNNTDLTYRLYSETKNIPSGTTLSYKLKNNSGTDFSSHMTVTNNKVGANNVYASMKFDGNMPIGTYTLYTVYNGNSYETAIVNMNDTNLTNYTVTFNANGGVGTMNSITGTATYPVTLTKNTFTRAGYSFIGWNTKADGTGKSYVDGASITESTNITLYAMWKRDYVAVTGININASKVSLGVNGEYTLKATVTPSDATDKTITWTSSNPNVATVDSTGKVTALALGTTTITATTVNNLKASATIVVANDIRNTKVSDISSQSYTGKSIKPNVIVTDGDKTLVKDIDYVLSYKNNKKLGTATITITGIGNYIGTTTKTFKIVIGNPKTIAAKTQTSSSITINWSKPSGSITGYQVYYSTKKDSGFKRLTTITKNKTLSYKKTKLSSNKVYYFKVRAYKTISKKNYYSSYTTVIGATTATKAPSIKVSSNTNSATISWKKISGATNYEIYQSTDKKKYTKVGTTSELSYKVENLSSAKTYYYKVRAYKTYNNKNVRSSYSKVVSTTTKPTTPVVTLSSKATSVTIKWNKVSRASGYVIYQSTDGKKYSKIKTITKGSTTSYTKTKLAKSKGYYYKVKAYKKVGSKKVYSSNSKVTYIATKPVAPKVKVSLANNSVKLSWSKVSGVSGYEVYVSNTKDTGYVLLTTTKNLSYTHSNLTSNTTYYYRVRAIKYVKDTKFNGSIRQVVGTTK